MDERTAQSEAKRLQLGRRVKRGIVAGYIHELSARHQAGAAREAVRREAAVATAPRA